MKHKKSICNAFNSVNRLKYSGSNDVGLSLTLPFDLSSERFVKQKIALCEIIPKSAK